MTVCPRCNGTGCVGATQDTCLACNGTGEVEECEACCGSGYISFWTDDGHVSMRGCRRCHGYGYVGVKALMTNEEWFCSLSTEEKAKWMAKHMSFCEVCEIVTCRGDGCLRFDRENMTETDAFREWLKEKHVNDDD